MQEAVINSDALVTAARRRLELWDLSPAQIDQIRNTENPIRSVTLYSPVSGFVLARNSFPSQRVTPDTELYAIADLSRVWIMADVFEADIDKVHVGQIALIHVPTEGRSIPAHVNYIQPEVDPTSRTLKLRLEAKNPGLRLKPDMFVDVELQVHAAPKMTVPVDAVLDSGIRKTVFLDRGNGFLEPRDVEAGDRIGDRIEIRKGLQPGDRIVTSGTFLVDSESRLKASAGGMAGMPGMPGMTGGQGAPPSSKPAAPKSAPSEQEMRSMPGMEHKHD